MTRCYYGHLHADSIRLALEDDYRRGSTALFRQITSIFSRSASDRRQMGGKILNFFLNSDKIPEKTVDFLYEVW